MSSVTEARLSSRAQAPELASRQVIVTLARVEGIRLVRHPIFLMALALSIAFLAIASAREPGVSYWSLVFFGFVPLGAGALLVANLAALRSSRHRTDDLYTSLPCPASTRTVSLLLATFATVPVSAALLAAGYVYLNAGSGLEVTWEGTTAVPSVPELAQGPAAVVVLGLLGVALARLIPSTVVGPLAVVVLFAVEYALGGSNWPLHSSDARWFLPIADPSIAPTGMFWPCYKDPTAMPCGVERFASASVGWHLLYLAGLGLLCAAVALLRHRRRPRLNVALTVALVAMIAAGVTQLP